MLFPKFICGVSNILQKFLTAAYLRFISNHFPRLVHWAMKTVTALVGLFSGI